MEKRQCWVEHNTNKALDWRMDDDVGLCLGFLAGDESAERKGEGEEGGEGEEKGKGKKKCRRITTYVTSLKKTGPCGHVYICNVNLFLFFLPPPPPLPSRNRRFLICPFQRVFKISIFKFQKERKKKRKEKKCIVSCRVVSLTLELGIVLNALSKV